MLEDRSDELWGDPEIRDILIDSFRTQVVNSILGKGHRGAVIVQSDDGADVEVSFNTLQPDWEKVSVPEIVTLDTPSGAIKLGLERAPGRSIVYGRAYV